MSSEMKFLLPNWLVSALFGTTASREIGVDPPCDEFCQLSSSQAAAVVMMTLPVDKSAEIFSRMTETSVQRITKEIIDMPCISGEVRRQALAFLAERLGIGTDGLAEMVQYRPELLADELVLWVANA